MECHGNIVDNKALANNGFQCIVTVGGYLVPFAVRTGLIYMDMRPPTDAELHEGPAQLPQVILTSDLKWDPAQIDSEPDYATYFDAVSDLADLDRDLPFDDYGEYISDPAIAALCHNTHICAKLDTVELPNLAEIIHSAQEG